MTHDSSKKKKKPRDIRDFIAFQNEKKRKLQETSSSLPDSPQTSKTENESPFASSVKTARSQENPQTQATVDTSHSQENLQTQIIVYTPHSRESPQSVKSSIAKCQVDASTLPHDPGKRKKIVDYHPNDRDAVRRAYIQRGPFQPRSYVFPRRDIGGVLRRFNPSWFDKYHWLEYSIENDAAFCFICYLFKDETTRVSGGDGFVSGGFKSWNKYERLDRHVGGFQSAHNQALMKFEALKNQKTSISSTYYKQAQLAKNDSKELRKAFSGWGTNEGLIISILGHRNAAQRKQIRQAYHETYGEELLKELDRELTNDFERAVLLWTLDPPERDAHLANEATKRWTSSNQVLMEIACTRSANQLLQARQAYHARYKKSLEEDVAYHTSGDFRKLLVPLVSAYRYEGDEVDTHLAKTDAKLIHEKIGDKHYNDEDLVRILSTRSKAQINATLNHYNNEYGNEINKDLKAEPKDEFLALLRSTIKCLTRPERYFEKVLRLAINKRGTDEGALTRVITTRAEVDLKVIAEEYQRRNSVPLDHAIVKDTHGDYEKMLLALVGHEEA